ncbi:MAG TPA: 5-formyltetrahydrofolate cyclo-ligase [Armatimonadota bacterium]|nr:5-formyltetrahydrofolate cyclo-ligase [Armatimonadota bacterium]
MECKPDLRRAAITRRDNLPAQEIRRRSAAASSHLFGLPEFRFAATAMFFVSFGSEIDTLPMIETALAQGKRVAAPRADPGSRALLPCEIRNAAEDLAPGAHNIQEPRAHCPPVALEEIDLVIVPAAVWGEDGYRIGYGGGYYDRFLVRLPRATRVGLGLETQVVAQVPHGPQDLPVDCLVTEAGVRRFAGGDSDSAKGGHHVTGPDST